MLKNDFLFDQFFLFLKSDLQKVLRNAKKMQDKMPIFYKVCLVILFIFFSLNKE
jgi:hypothetical protein